MRWELRRERGASLGSGQFFPCQERTCLKLHDQWWLQKGQSFNSGLCSGTPSGGKSQTNRSGRKVSPWPAVLAGSLTSATLLFSMPCPLSSLPQKPTFPPAPCGTWFWQQGLKSGWGQPQCYEHVLMGPGWGVGRRAPGDLGLRGRAWGPGPGASAGCCTDSGRDSKSPPRALWHRGSLAATNANHTTGACCILWQQQLFVNSVMLEADSIIGYFTMAGEHPGSWASLFMAKS